MRTAEWTRLLDPANERGFAFDWSPVTSFTEHTALALGRYWLCDESEWEQRLSDSSEVHIEHRVPRRYLPAPGISLSELLGVAWPHQRVLSEHQFLAPFGGPCGLEIFGSP